MRILHTSDWHLGQYFFGKSRAQEHKKFLAWLVEKAKEHQVDAIVVAGDIFDTGSPPSYAREIYFDFIHQLQSLPFVCQLVVLAGNHDSVAMISESKQLLKSFHVHVVPSTLISESEQVFVLPNTKGESSAVICAVPYIRPREVITSEAGQSHADKQKALQQGISQHYQKLYQHAKKLSNGKLPIIGTGHLTTVGASVSDSVREIYIGTLDAFPASAFPDFDYLALGHIHQHQVIAKSAHIRYCGSPIPLSFDEAKQQKQVLLVDVEYGKTANIIQLNIPNFQPLVMVKGDTDSILLSVEKAIACNHNDQPVWLDIEIESHDYHSNIQAKITEQLQPYLAAKQIEILLIRRSKVQRQKLLKTQQTTTLEELKPAEVFEARLLQETEFNTSAITNTSTNSDESENANEQSSKLDGEKKQRLTQLFQQTLNDTLAESDERLLPQEKEQVS